MSKVHLSYVTAAYDGLTDLALLLGDALDGVDDTEVKALRARILALREEFDQLYTQRKSNKPNVNISLGTNRATVLAGGQRAQFFYNDDMLSAVRSAIVYCHVVQPDAEIYVWSHCHEISLATKSKILRMLDCISAVTLAELRECVEYLGCLTEISENVLHCNTVEEEGEVSALLGAAHEQGLLTYQQHTVDTNPVITEYEVTWNV